ncbi:CUB and sushi domain-containing protein 3-like, partial [Scleropages formosus]
MDGCPPSFGLLYHFLEDAPAGCLLLAQGATLPVIVADSPGTEKECLLFKGAGSTWRRREEIVRLAEPLCSRAKGRRSRHANALARRSNRCVSWRLSPRVAADGSAARTGPTESGSNRVCSWPPGQRGKIAHKARPLGGITKGTSSTFASPTGDLDHLRSSIFRGSAPTDAATLYRGQYSSLRQRPCVEPQKASMASFVATDLDWYWLTGFQIPPPVTSTGSVFSLRLTSDFAVSAHGFKIYYEDVQITIVPRVMDTELQPCCGYYLKISLEDTVTPVELQSSSCGNPGVPPKGILYGTRFNVGDKIRYSCVTGYVLDGHPQLTCVTNAGNTAVWDFPVPICRARRPLAASLFQFIEMPSGISLLLEDYLKWTHERVHCYLVLVRAREIYSESDGRLCAFTLGREQAVYLRVERWAGQCMGEIDGPSQRDYRLFLEYHFQMEDKYDYLEVEGSEPPTICYTPPVQSATMGCRDEDTRLVRTTEAQPFIWSYAAMWGFATEEPRVEVANDQDPAVQRRNMCPQSAMRGSVLHAREVRGRGPQGSACQPRSSLLATGRPPIRLLCPPLMNELAGARAVLRADAGRPMADSGPVQSLSRLSGMNIPSPIVSNKNWLRLHFVTDSNHRYRGFSAHYQEEII